MASFVERVQNILLKPNAEWAVIDGEPATVQGLFLGYAAVLAAIPAIADFLGTLLSGFLVHSFAPLTDIIDAILLYVLSLAAVFALGFIINALAASFGSRSDQLKAMKVAVYSGTPAWVGGVLLFIPVLGWLAVGAGMAYGLVLTFFGVSKVMKPPADKAAGYAVIAIVASLFLSFAILIVRLVVAWMFTVVSPLR